MLDTRVKNDGRMAVTQTIDSGRMSLLTRRQYTFQINIEDYFPDTY